MNTLSKNVINVLFIFVKLKKSWQKYYNLKKNRSLKKMQQLNFVQ